MFSLLNPISLWLGALLAAPLIIHFLGRQRLRKQPFPSLLLVREKFSRSMHRHRLKNFLLLIIRTLLILCLLLALGNPVLKGRGAAGRPEVVMALVHNGIYGKLPAGPGADATGNSAEASDGGTLERQRKAVRTLDSAAGARARVFPLIADGPSGKEASERYGDYREALSRLAAALPVQASTVEWRLPVFAWADLDPAREVLLGAMRDHPNLQVVLADYGDEGARVDGFTGVKATPSPRAPTVTLLAGLNPIAASPGRVRVFLDGRLFQEAAPQGPRAEVVLPLQTGPRTSGKLVREPATGFANAEFHFCFPNPGRMILAHAGSTLASLPSLGRENYFRKIVHGASARDIPWGSSRATPGDTLGTVRLVYLSNERSLDAAAYGRAVEFVKRGGHLILGAGKDVDVPLLNRFLLEPMRLGRLGALAEAAPAAVQADRAALARLGHLPPETGILGSVRKRFAFAAEPGTDILLSHAGQPVLAARDFHRGKVLLWTTDIDDLEWTDLGVSPITPLIHQAFQESGAEGITANQAVASDSIRTLLLPDPQAGRAEVVDPEGRPFSRVKADGARVRIGPFDRLGIYRVVAGGDTLAFAVNLAPRLSPGTGADWPAWNRDHKQEFLRALEPARARVTVADPEEVGLSRATVRPLWKLLFLAAILLLFLEGAISSLFALRRSRSQT